MINEIKKDITTVEEGVVLHGCNCSGGFGSGVAGAIRRVWPAVYQMFKENGTGEHLLGTTQFLLPAENSKLIIGNGYTQVFFGSDGKKYADALAVKRCVMSALKMAEAYSLPLYMPKIGCGLGGLSWENEIKPMLEKVSLEFSEVNIFICDL